MYYINSYEFPMIIESIVTHQRSCCPKKFDLSVNPGNDWCSFGSFVDCIVWKRLPLVHFFGWARPSLLVPLSKNQCVLHVLNLVYSLEFALIGMLQMALCIRWMCFSCYPQLLEKSWNWRCKKMPFYMFDLLPC